MKKKYCIDTNVLIDDPNCINILRNGEENDIYIPINVLLELDKLKNDNTISHMVRKAVEAIRENYDNIKFIKSDNYVYKSTDLAILDDILKSSDKDDMIFVTNDRMFRILSDINEVKSEEYKNSIPFKSEAQNNTGIYEDYKKAEINTFYWKKEDYKNEDTKEIKSVDCAYFRGVKSDRRISDITEDRKIFPNASSVWGIIPKDYYQKFAMELMLNEDIDLVSINAEAGLGKTQVSLACAFQLAYQNTEKGKVNPKERKYKKIYVIKPIMEIGKELGSLPGTLQEKIFPHMVFIKPLVQKLHELRPFKRIFEDSGENMYNTRYLEVIPINYLRGMTISDSIVLLEEAQNLTRYQIRSVLSRMGENVKCFVLGDTNQIDNPFLNSENNGLNWLVKTMKGHQKYAHLVLDGEHSRGPIADMVRQKGL